MRLHKIVGPSRGMSAHDPYPDTVREVLDDDMRFNADALRAVHDLRRSRPWTGTADERRQKFARLVVALSNAYAIEVPRLVFRENDNAGGGGKYLPLSRTLVLGGRISVITALHEFAHHRGMGERAACRWSINLFKRVFPNEFARCRHEGHMLRAPRHPD